MECYDLRWAVLDSEVERLYLPRRGDVDAALDALENLGQVLVSDEATESASSNVISSGESLLPAAQLIVDQLQANDATDTSASVPTLVREIAKDMELLLDEANTAWDLDTRH